MKRIRMKKSVSLFLAVVMVILCIPMTVIETSAMTEGRFTYVITDGGAIITKVDNNSKGEIVVPDSLGGYPVNRIGSEAFRGCEYIYHITIPDSVTSIGMLAFYECTRLKKITVTEGNPAYKSVDGVLFTIDGETIVCYPAGRTDAEYSVPADVRTVGDHAFAWCSSLKDITIPDSVKSIGSSAFYYCTGLSEITVPEGVEVIEEFVFFGCSGLVDVIIPEGVTEIKTQAFSYCTGITDVVIPDSVKSLGSAFSHCTSLENINVPDTVTDIDQYVIYNTAYYNDPLNWDNGVLYIGKHLITADGTVNGEYTVKDGTLNIANSAFYACADLVSVTVPEGVKNIGKQAFMWCEKLKRVDLPEGLVNIGKDAFALCIKLTDINIPDSVTYIGEGVFRICNSLGNVNIPEGITKIEKYTFAGCILNEVIIPEGVTEIGDNAFENCKKLTNITISAGVTNIGKDVFFGCDNVTVRCYTNSVAHKYVVDNNIPYIRIDADSAVYHGDADGDGKINLTDVALILKYIAKWDVAPDLDTADVTGDGKVNLADASRILQYIAKWDVTFK
ncbi:MAG: hypothetical protein E7578_02350 [Ruminococcaceae bacterium]|nr:hypothetical protein [Oscillospiraceae bacterium]